MTRQHASLVDALSDRYTIEREVGAGGMATVFLAQDVKHQRKVALKVLRPELSSAMGAERFPREIRLVAQLHHPHILSLYDSGEAAGFLYYVMPYVEGESLRERLTRESRLPVHDAVRILRDVADALAYSHARGVVHRDIKPGNVLLSGRHAVVTDFGVAKALSKASDDKTTTVGIAIGTPQYMAPEQAMGESDIDHRADIYALGILGYEMLSGSPPFDGTSAQAVLAAQVLNQPVDLQTVRAGLSPVVNDIIMRCLAKAPGDRWQSAEELVSKLENIGMTPSGGLTPTDTRPLRAMSLGASTPKTATPAGISSRKRMIVAAVIVLAIAAGAAGAWELTRNAAPARIEKIGVMPIEDISGKDSIFVAAMHDALTNSLTASLAKSHLSDVAQRSAMMRYKGGTKTMREIAQEQQLGAVVEATVFRAGDVMRINVQFTDPVTSKALWTDTYDQDVSNVLSAQKDVVAKIAAGIRAALATTAKSGNGS